MKNAKLHTSKLNFITYFLNNNSEIILSVNGKELEIVLAKNKEFNNKPIRAFLYLLNSIVLIGDFAISVYAPIWL